MRTHSGMCYTPTLFGPSIPGQASFNISFSRRSTMLRSWRPNLTSHEVVVFYFGYIRVTIAGQFQLLSSPLRERSHTDCIFHTCRRLKTGPDDSSTSNIHIHYCMVLNVCGTHRLLYGPQRLLHTNITAWSSALLMHNYCTVLSISCTHALPHGPLHIHYGMGTECRGCQTRINTCRPDEWK